MPGPYEIVTVFDNTLTILEEDIENTVSTVRATKSPGFQDVAVTNGDTHNKTQFSHTQANDADNNDNDKFIVDENALQITENGDRKYIVR